MSRNARSHTFQRHWLFWLLCALPSLSPKPPAQAADSLLLRGDPRPSARVVIVHDPGATEAFQPRDDIVRAMIERAITNLTRKPAPADAWRSLLTTQDIIGIKVYSAPGANSGTRPAVVAGIIEGLLAARIPASQIILWDKHRADLRRAGFIDLAARHGIRAEGSSDQGYDEKVFYDKEFLGHLLWEDLEFGRTGQGVGRKSFVSKLVTRGMTKIINVTPLLNHNHAGVTGNLISLALGSVDNSFRFETDRGRLAEAVPEIYALPALGDRVVLNVVDALVCQYQGEQLSLLHYSTVLNELRFSSDPVALDLLSLQELDRQRQAAGMISVTNNLELYQNASLLELGVGDLSSIQVEHVK